MNRLVVRLVISHLLVAVLGAAATFLIVRQLAPAIFDRSLTGTGAGNGRGPGAGGELRAQVASAVTQALGVGALVGAVAATAFGALAAYRLVRPLRTVAAATREMAQGRYAVPVPRPREVEVAALVDDVNTLGQALAETESRRVRLLGEVAHEMRTPLTVVDGYIEGMIDGVLPTGPADLAPVADEVRRLRRLVEDLSQLSRAQEGRTTLEMQDLDLRSVVSGAAERLRPQALDAGLILAVDLTVEPVPVRADPDRLAQVITNLVGTAVRATPAGGRIEVRVQSAGETSTCTVGDTGEGLAPEDLERIFERFYRVAGQRPGPGGSGIGLTIARGIVLAHGGTLTATSAGLGHGCVFTMTLPRSPR